MADVTIQVMPNGPVRVQGNVLLLDVKGQPIPVEGKVAFALCRCGQSKNKPFCDGSHKAANFRPDAS